MLMKSALQFTPHAVNQPKTDPLQDIDCSKLTPTPLYTRNQTHIIDPCEAELNRPTIERDKWSDPAAIKRDRQMTKWSFREGEVRDLGVCG